MSKAKLIPAGRPGAGTHPDRDDRPARPLEAGGHKEQQAHDQPKHHH